MVVLMFIELLLQLLRVLLYELHTLLHNFLLPLLLQILKIPNINLNLLHKVLRLDLIIKMQIIASKNIT